MIKNKYTLLTFVSTAALLGLYTATNSQEVHADTVETSTEQTSTNTNSQTQEETTATNIDTDNTTQQADNTEKSTLTTTNADNTTQDNSPKVTSTIPSTDNTTQQADTQEVSIPDLTSDDSSYIETSLVATNSTESTTSSNVTSTSTKTTKKVDYDINPVAQEALLDAEIDPSSLSKEQIDQLNKIDFAGDNPDGSAKWTYDNYVGTATKMLEQDEQYRVPYFNAKKMQNMPATTTKDAQTGKKEALDIWDSWPVQDAKTGKVYNYKGYQLVIAMMGIPGQNDSHIYLLYNKYNDNNLKHWKSAGPIFGFKANAVNQEWSGSATVNKDGSIQLFYTDVDTSQGDNHQKISTVNLKLKVNKKKNKITITKRSHRKVLFEGDGKFYQTYDQWKAKNKGADNIAMRDAHVIEVKGRRYLVFEASTGSNNYQGADQIYNWRNYGGDTKTALQNFFKITSNEDMTSRATWANAAIGILRLSKNENNPKVDKVMAPLVTSLMVSDEIERPNLLKMNGKYYLFATTRLNRGTGDDLWQAADKEIGDNVAMLGWVSDHLTYGYKPLNGDGTVLVASVPFNWRTATYSYYAAPVKGSKTQLLVTSYMTNRGFAAGKGKLSTLAPAFLINVEGDKTSVIQKATNQGDWVYDKKSVNKKMLTKTIKGAHLDGEPIDKSQLKEA